VKSILDFDSLIKLCIRINSLSFPERGENEALFYSTEILYFNMVFDIAIGLRLSFPIDHYLHLLLVLENSKRAGNKWNSKNEGLAKRA
jgi:hypothetical protein